MIVLIFFFFVLNIPSKIIRTQNEHSERITTFQRCEINSLHEYKELTSL